MFKKIIIFTLAVIMCIGIGVGIGVIAGAVRHTPKVDDTKIEFAETSFFYDANETLFAKQSAGENREYVELDKVPRNLRDAIISIEDKDFYRHPGINVKRIIGALIADIKAGSKVQGASTITQQLARNAFLTSEKTYTRKIKEAIIAMRLEHKYDKQEILEFYLNRIYFGHGAYGAQTAAQTYFGKDVSKLSLKESAMVAGVLNSPGNLSPYLHPEASERRTALVLDRMAAQGYISTSQANEAKNAQLDLIGLEKAQAQRPHNFDKAPYFTEYVRQQLVKKYGADMVYKGGLKVYTTLDLNMQQKAQAGIDQHLPKGEEDKNGIRQPQVALVTMDTQTGYIKAMIGGRNFKETQLNRTVQTPRQPGSSFKPFVYLAAIDSKNYTPGSIIEDEPVSFGNYSPHNYDNKYHGPVTLRYALNKSINVVAVKLLDRVGVNSVTKYAKQLGIQNLQPEDRNLSMALGGLYKGVTPLEMARAYGVFAAGGTQVQPLTIVKVMDKEGNVLEENVTTSKDVLNPQTAYMMASMLRSVVTNGTGGRANIGRPIAGKTGTTSDYNDAWFVGFTPDLVTSVWIGNDEVATPENGKPNYNHKFGISSSYPARIFGTYMKQAVAGTPVHNFERPSGIVGPIEICTVSGENPTNKCYAAGTVVGEYFIAGTEPIGTCAYHDNAESVEICTESGLLANDSCPETKTLYRFPKEDGTYEGDEFPTEPCNIHKDSIFPEIHIPENLPWPFGEDSEEEEPAA